MRGFEEDGFLAYSEFTSERVQSGGICLRQRGNALGAVAIFPADMMQALAGGLDELTQEILLSFRQIHASVFRGHASRSQF